MISYKQSSVVDNLGYYVDFVLVMETEIALADESVSTQWTIQNYKLQEGECLVDMPCPHARIHAGDMGIVKFRWDGNQWVEGATSAEITQWEQEHPAPDVVPTVTEQLRADIDFLALMGGISL